jgi:pyruvate dehydrogenase E1 component alpha subunit
MKDVKKDELIKMYAAMVKIRRVEERLMEVFATGVIPGFIHVSIGQEAVAVGVCSALRKDDYITNTHRGHGQAIAKGIDLKGFIAEIYGKRNGVCKGRSGSMHIADKASGILGSNGIVGGGIPLAMGNAFASQYLNDGRVTVCFFGDGASNEGTFHESLNLASLWNLPIMFCCENNEWAQFTPIEKYIRIEEISKRAAAYGMPGISVDGDDILAVYDAAKKAVNRARKGKGPTLIECKTHRWFGHFAGDKQKYRSPEEIETVRQYDPIQRLQKRLAELNILGAKDIGSIEQRIRWEIEQAVKFAEESPSPEPGELFDDVYGEEK